jgi:hypothetical protein
VQTRDAIKIQLINLYPVTRGVAAIAFPVLSRYLPVIFLFQDVNWRKIVKIGDASELSKKQFPIFFNIEGKNKVK